jgi:hypothetical protein
MIPTMDPRTAARILDLADERARHGGSRSRAFAGFALILALAAHGASTSGSPPSAQAAAMSPAGARQASKAQAGESPEMKQLMAIGVAAAVSAGASAQDAVQWRVEDGGNGHWYVLASGSPACFESWQAFAQSEGGHLATIATNTEQAFLTSLLSASSSAMIGSSRPPSSDIYTGWTWLTGEPFSASSILWAPGNPGCYGPNEFWLWLQGNGVHDGWQCGAMEVLIEVDADCNDDGAIDGTDLAIVLAGWGGCA